MALLDIVTPVLNGDKYIAETISTVLPLVKSGFATYNIVDSGSTDNTQSIVRSNGLSLLYTPPGNMYAAVNHGLALSHSEWCCYVNSDDSLCPTAIASAINTIGHLSDVIYSDCFFINSSSSPVSLYKSPHHKLASKFLHYGFMPFAQPTLLIRRDVFSALQGFNLDFRYCSDFDFCLRASLLPNIRFHKYSPSPLASFRVHEQQLSQLHSKQMASEVLNSLTQNGFRVNKYMRFVSRQLAHISSFFS